MKSKIRGMGVLALGLLILACAGGGPNFTGATASATSPRIETFTFSSNGSDVRGKIYLPTAYETDRNLPAIFLIDYTEQHFVMATDEFEQVIEGVRQVQGLDALVVTLDDIPDVDAEPEMFQEHYDLFRSMTAFVDGNYTNNPSRTFIGKGSEAGVVLIELLEDETFPTNKANKKLHLSFSTSNVRALCISLIDLFERAQYPWLTFEATEYTDSDCETTYPTSYAAGTRFVFSS